MCSLLCAPLHFVLYIVALEYLSHCIVQSTFHIHSFCIPEFNQPQCWWMLSPQIQRADGIILYKGLEHLRILVSTGGPGTNSLQIPRDDCTYYYMYLLAYLSPPTGYKPKGKDGAFLVSSAPGMYQVFRFKLSG